MKHYNIITAKDYEGQNQVDLMITAKKKGYKSFKWGTFLQWKEKGKMIKKGEHATGVFKGYGRFDDTTKDGKLKVESRPLGWARVFNEDQTQIFKSVKV